MSGLPTQGVGPRPTSRRWPWPPAGLLLAVLQAVLVTACGAALQKLPVGPGAAAPDAVAIFDDASRACRAVHSLSAEMGVSGSAGGQRLRGRVLVGLAEPASALLDAAAPFGASIFIYAARDGRATLLLPRDRRVLRDGDPAEVLAAVTGVPLNPDDLRQALIGCPGGDGAAAADGRSFGTDWRAVRSGPAEVFLRRVDSRWRVVAIVHDAAAATAWRADYTQFAGDLPRGVRLMSTATGRAFDLRLQLSQVEINPVLAASVFTVTVPDGTAPLTLDELRGADPMADAGR